MHVYRKAMFNSYLVPVVIFYFLPMMIPFLFSIGSLMAFQVLAWVLAFPIILFFIGAYLAPIFGPKIVTNKSLSFVMAAISNLLALLILLIAFGLFTDSLTWEAFRGGLVILLFYSFFPAMLGAYLFIGSCERIEKI